MTDDIFNEVFPAAKVWGYSKTPRYRAKKVLRHEHHAAPRPEWHVARRLPLLWLNIYLPLKFWHVDQPGEMPKKRWARYTTASGAEKFIATKPAFFPKKPEGVLNDIHYYDEKGGGVILGSAKVRKERVF